MSLNKYLFFMALGALISWGAWYLVLRTTDPLESGFLGFLFFYLTLFFALVGTFSVIGFFIRKLALKDELAFRHVVVSFRQAILFSILITGSLILQSLSLLTWWNIILFILALTVLEFFFISFKVQST